MTRSGSLSRFMRLLLRLWRISKFSPSLMCSYATLYVSFRILERRR